MHRIRSLLLGGVFIVGMAIPESVAAVQVSTAAGDLGAIAQQDRQIRTTVFLALIPVVVAFSFIVFIFYRAKRESFFKQKEAEFRLNISETEMKALRAQINPHFIFNCLNSIHHYMQQHDVNLAGEYLIKFSRLIRYVLETSSQRMVSLTDDLEALKLYMELEQLRMQRSFEFEINTNALPDPGSISIPPMMMQPFVENSIWHGLNDKGSGGQIKISVVKKDQMIQCLVEDNGHRKHKKENDPASMIKKTSMGMSLIKERLSVVSRIYHVNSDFRMEDRMNDRPPAEGTRIVLVLPFED